MSTSGTSGEDVTACSSAPLSRGNDPRWCFQSSASRRSANARARIRDAAVFFFRLEGLDQRRERAQRDGRAQRVRRARGDRAQTREERLGFGARRPGVQGVRRVRL